MPGTLRLERTGGQLRLWRRGTPDDLVPVGTAGSAYAGPGYLMTIDLDAGGAPITQLVLDLERAPALLYQLLKVG